MRFALNNGCFGANGNFQLVKQMPMDEHYQLIRERYQKSRGDSTELFETVLSVASETGLERALAYLEQCVIEKRLGWLQENLGNLPRTADPVFDGYRLFYEFYLGVSVPEDGEIIEKSEHRIVTRWWNKCPTLEVCQMLGLDTREICKAAYHQPVQEFLEQINPKLRFERNYDRLRPYTAYCEEIIVLGK
jgi:hypothetical protein